MMPKIIDFSVTDKYRVQLQFDDGVEGTIDFSDKVGKGVYSEWADPEKFKEIEITSTGDLLWSNKVDICADSLYLKVTGKSANELFKTLKAFPENA